MPNYPPVLKTENTEKAFNQDFKSKRKKKI
jgi:hypothetical protein